MQMATLAGVRVAKPHIGSLARLEASDTSATFTCVFDRRLGSQNSPFESPADLLVAAEPPTLPAVAAAAAAAAGLVIDGRLVVDGGFAAAGGTGGGAADVPPRVLAAGPAARYARAAGGMPHDVFTSDAVGAELALSVASAAAVLLDAPLPHADPAARPVAPRLGAAAAAPPLAASLPGGARFALAATPARRAAPRTGPSAGGAAVETTSPCGAVRLLLDEYSMIEQAAYLGAVDNKLTAQRLQALVGMPSSIVSESLADDVAAGKVRFHALGCQLSLTFVRNQHCSCKRATAICVSLYHV